MSGLAVFFLIGLYILAGYKLVKSLQPGYRKWLTIASVVLIPTADAIVGRIYLQHLCVTEGGLRVYRIAQEVEGFMSDGGDSGMHVERYGYKFSESTPINGRVNRYSKYNGQVVKEEGVYPKSKYRVRFQTTGRRETYMRDMDIVETFPDGEKLAVDVQIGFNGGWAERFLAVFSDGGSGGVAWCEGAGNSVVRRRELIASSLKQ